MKKSCCITTRLYLYVMARWLPLQIPIISLGLICYRANWAQDLGPEGSKSEGLKSIFTIVHPPSLTFMTNA